MAQQAGDAGSTTSLQKVKKKKEHHNPFTKQTWKNHLDWLATLDPDFSSYGRPAKKLAHFQEEGGETDQRRKTELNGKALDSIFRHLAAFARRERSEIAESGKQEPEPVKRMASYILTRLNEETSQNNYWPPKKEDAFIEQMHNWCARMPGKNIVGTPTSCTETDNALPTAAPSAQGQPANTAPQAQSQDQSPASQASQLQGQHPTSSAPQAPQPVGLQASPNDVPHGLIEHLEEQAPPIIGTEAQKPGLIAHLEEALITIGITPNNNLDPRNIDIEAQKPASDGAHVGVVISLFLAGSLSSVGIVDDLLRFLSASKPPLYSCQQAVIAALIADVVSKMPARLASRELPPSMLQPDFTVALGQGTFGVVFQGMLACVKVAIKIFKTDGDWEDEVTAYRNVVGLPVCVELIATCELMVPTSAVTQKKYSGQKKGIVLEWHPLSLEQYMEQQENIRTGGQPDSSKEDIKKLQHTMKIAVDVTQGTEVLHSRRTYVRDIKPENFMIGVDGKPRFIDLGLAKKRSENKKFRTKVGSGSYMAPEVGIGPGYDIEKADIYALGMTIKNLFARIHGYVPSQVASITDECLNLVADLRPTASALCAQLKEVDFASC